MPKPGPQVEANGLTRKEHQFVRCYIETGMNAVEAARRMGIKGKEDSLRRSGERYLASDRVRVAVNEALDKVREAEGLRESSAVVRELEAVGFANMQDFVDGAGMLKPLGDLPREVAAAVTDYEFHPERGFKIKLASKLGALQTLAKLYGFGPQKDKGSAAPQVAVQVNLMESKWKDTDKGAAVEASYSSQ